MPQNQNRVLDWLIALFSAPSCKRMDFLRAILLVGVLATGVTVPIVADAQTRGNLDAAEEFQKRALALNEALGHKEVMADTLKSLGLIAWTRGDRKQAREHFNRAVALYDEIGAGASANAQIARISLASLPPD